VRDARDDPDGEAGVGRRGRVAVGVVLLGILLCVVLPGCQPERLRPPIQISSGERSFPDPSVLYAEGRYHAYSTTSSGASPRNVQVMTSTDLHQWSGLADAMPVPPSWSRSLEAGGAFWAPTVARFGDRYVLYVAAMHGSTSSDDPGWCIAYATSADADGPFTPGPRPLLCQVMKQTARSRVSTTPPGPGRGVIDPQVFVAPDGATYLHFKALDTPYQLAGVGLTADGTAIRTDAYGLVNVAAKASVWEYSGAADHRFTILENPAMDLNPTSPASHRFYLYYSGNDWRTASYATGVATCAAPLGPCFRATADEPWMERRGSVGGPGGLSLFTTAGGRRWVAYHSWERGQPTTNGRRLHVEPLGYDGTTPTLLSRPPTGSLQVDVLVGAVTLEGSADDPDTGRRMEVILKEGSERLAVLTVGADARYGTTMAATPGEHRYCAFVVDDNGLGTRQLGCQTVTVPPAPSAPAPAPAPAPSPTSPPTSSSTTPSGSTSPATTP